MAFLKKNFSNLIKPIEPFYQHSVNSFIKKNLEHPAFLTTLLLLVFPLLCEKKRKNMYIFYFSCFHWLHFTVQESVHHFPPPHSRHMTIGLLRSIFCKTAILLLADFLQVAGYDHEPPFDHSHSQRSLLFASRKFSAR